ncbi:MAG: HD domain-containing protein [Lachnospiraceae bacterium]|nr:HD domain-containing protein [Lachnospiraceae bacterium]
MEEGREEQNTGKNNELIAYVDLTNRIRALSAPRVDAINGEEDYRMTLLENFVRIGELARANGRILENYFLPLMDEGRQLSDRDVNNLRSFGKAILDARNAENLDQMMVFLQAQRLMQDAELKGDVPALIRALDDMVAAAGAMAVMTLRLYPVCRDFINYRALGLAAAVKLLSFLEPERFATLTPEQKESVLINSRYVCILFQREDLLGDAKTNAYDLETMIRALRIAEDPFYREQAPEYDWDYHIFRALQYICLPTEYNNYRGFSAEQLTVIEGYAGQLKDFFEENYEKLSAVNSRESVDLIVNRARYLSGKMSEEDYFDFLRTMPSLADENDFSYDACFLKILAPIEYLSTLDHEHLTAAQEKEIDAFYRGLVLHLHRLPQKGTQMYLLGDLANVMKNYIDVPGGLGFENFCLELTAAVHPPTYVHVLSVADFTVCLTRQLLKRHPELFVGMPGYDSIDAVVKGTDDIISFAGHAALCHDIGKLFIVETIITYGRPLFDCEFGWIKTHPDIGANLLEQHESTKRYANVARGHHRWFNNGGGYPENYDFQAAPDKVMVAIVECADCLDASTDSVGRSYKTGKTLEDFIGEVQAGSGTRYAPYLAELLLIPEVQSDLRKILKSGRDENYRRAYEIIEEFFHTEEEER